MYKGSPISPISRSQNPITISRIGTPQAQALANTPIADRYAHQTEGAKTPDSPGWLRRVGDFEFLTFANESSSRIFLSPQTIQISPHPPQSTLQTLAPPLSSFPRRSSATALSNSDYMISSRRIPSRSRISGRTRIDRMRDLKRGLKELR